MLIDVVCMIVCVWTPGRIANANAGANGDPNKSKVTFIFSVKHAKSFSLWSLQSAEGSGRRRLPQVPREVSPRVHPQVPVL